MNYYDESILNSSIRQIYVKDIELLKQQKDLIPKNTLLLSSYNFNFEHNNHNYIGTSYELYYSDQNANITQLTYNVVSGNGLTIDENMLMSVNIDNYTLKQNEENKLYVDQYALTSSYYNLRGIIRGDNGFYHNSSFMDKSHNSVVTSNGYIQLNTGLYIDLYEIYDYYNKIQKLDVDINNLWNLILNDKTVFKLGDLLYKSQDGGISLDKNDEPYMVCVIASGLLNDGMARFIKLKRVENSTKFALDATMLPTNKTFSSVPIYNASYRKLNSSATPIIEGDFGFIATDRKDWLYNSPNKFNTAEHYYFTDGITLNKNYLPLDWMCVNAVNFLHKPNYIYQLAAGAICSYTTTADCEDIYPTISIEFDDGFIDEYKIHLKYIEDQRRYISREVYPSSYTNVKYVFRNIENAYSNNADIDVDLYGMLNTTTKTIDNTDIGYTTTIIPYTNYDDANKYIDNEKNDSNLITPPQDLIYNSHIYGVATVDSNWIAPLINVDPILPPKNYDKEDDDSTDNQNTNNDKDNFVDLGGDDNGNNNDSENNDNNKNTREDLDIHTWPPSNDSDDSENSDNNNSGSNNGTNNGSTNDDNNDNNNGNNNGNDDLTPTGNSSSNPYQFLGNTDLLQNVTVINTAIPVDAIDTKFLSDKISIGDIEKYSDTNYNALLSSNPVYYANITYRYKLVMSPNLTNLNYMYLKLRYRLSKTQWSNWYFAQYDNNKGLIWLGLIDFKSPCGQMEILAYASPNLLDKNPYNFGQIFECREIITNNVIKNGYCYKVVYVTKSSSYDFNLYSIKMKSAKVVKQDHNRQLVENAFILNETISNKIKLNYVFDKQYVYKHNLENQMYMLKEGAIQITREDGKIFDFQECSATVTFRFSDPFEDWDNLIYAMPITFKIDQTKTILRSSTISYKYPLSSINRAQISQFLYINYSNTTNITDYSFAKYATIRN